MRNTVCVAIQAISTHSNRIALGGQPLTRSLHSAVRPKCSLNTQTRHIPLRTHCNTLRTLVRSNTRKECAQSSVLSSVIGFRARSQPYTTLPEAKLSLPALRGPRSLHTSRMNGNLPGVPRQQFERYLDSVVKIFAVTVSPNYIQPWSVKPQRESTGSGFVIEGRRILTNAHVIANGTSIMVRKHGSPKKFPAKCEHTGHECDLAILTVDDDQFWEDLPHLELGDLPELQDKITVVGYPAGGDTVSLSVGVVSRVELQQYTHGAANLLAIQIDAAINPGNSGGPAFFGDRVVGVAFQHLPGAENIGYVIPVPIIQHFLNDIERHGKYTGFCRFGFFAQGLENTGMRRYLGLPEQGMDGGILVTRILPMSNAAEVLKKDDVIFSIDGIPLASDGTIPFRHRERIIFDYLLINKYVSDNVKLQVWRDNELSNMEVQLNQFAPLVPAYEYDKAPSYFIHAGLTFIPLVQPYLMEWGDDWYNASPRKLSQCAISGVAKLPNEQVVVLSMVLVDEINFQYQSMAQSQVLRFNGEKINNLADLKNKMLGCTDEFLRLDLENELVIVMRRDDAARANHRILCRHRISQSHSPDLADSESADAG